ncbi:MAG: hypothetical protein Q9181_004352 [Wetmoreana brouardii]
MAQQDYQRGAMHFSALFQRSCMQLTSRTLPDPYVWHIDGMISTWRFHEFRGRVPQTVCEMMWSPMMWRAADNMARMMGNLPVMQWPPWRREIRYSFESDHQWFDMVLQPRWALTWRMLAEAVYVPEETPGEDPRGAAWVCETTKEFYFDIWAKGKMVGNGWTIRRRDPTSETHAPRQLSSRAADPPLALSAEASIPPETKNLTAPPRDPFIWHRPGMTTTWEFHSFRGRVNVDMCKFTWNTIVLYALYNKNRGRGSFPYVSDPILPRVYPYTSPARAGRKVQTVLNPKWSMSFNMLAEATNSERVEEEGVGAFRVCEWAEEFYFDVYAKGKLVMWGSTRTIQEEPPEE